MEERLRADLVLLENEAYRKFGYNYTFSAGVDRNGIMRVQTLDGINIGHAWYDADGFTCWLISKDRLVKKGKK